MQIVEQIIFFVSCVLAVLSSYALCVEIPAYIKITSAPGDSGLGGYAHSMGILVASIVLILAIIGVANTYKVVF